MNLKYLHLSYLSFLFFSLNTLAQKFSIAPEVWSEPVRLDSFSQQYIGERSPSLTRNLDTMYFRRSGEILRSVKINGIWQTAVRLNNNVNNEVPTRHPSISKDGKRIYYSAWGGYGNWDIFYNDWNDTLNDWGPRRNMGSVINSTNGEYYLFEVCKDTVYTINSQWATLGPSSYAWNDSVKKWTLIDSFYFHPELGHGDLYGLSVAENMRKLYYGLRPWQTDVRNERGLELCVTYWDYSENTWGKSYFLNINTNNFWPDSNLSFGGDDINPWISQDGKFLFFDSNTDAALEDTNNAPDIFISYLLVDENGDTVTSIKENGIYHPGLIVLKQNYPNPYNNSTLIKYHLNESGIVALKVFDINGRYIVTLVNNKQSPGNYIINFNAFDYDLSSGIYIYQLKIGNTLLVRKMLYLK